MQLSQHYGGRKKSQRYIKAPFVKYVGITDIITVKAFQRPSYFQRGSLTQHSYISPVGGAIFTLPQVDHLLPLLVVIWENHCNKIEYRIPDEQLNLVFSSPTRLS